MIEVNGKYTTAKIMIDEVEETCMSQVVQFVNHPVFTGPVALMPDCHAGRGAVIGFTMPMNEKIIPATIGVDIGCGVCLTNIGKDLKIPLPEIDHKIRQRVPFGFNTHEHSAIDIDKEFPWKTANSDAQKFALAYLFAKTAASLPMPENDILFVFRDVYQWKALDELGINAYYTGRAQEAVTIFKHLLDKKLVPTEQTERTKANLGFAQAKLPGVPK